MAEETVDGWFCLCIREDTAERGQANPKWADSLALEPSRVAPWSGTCSQNCEEENICCLGRPICGASLQQLDWTPSCKALGTARPRGAQSRRVWGACRLTDLVVEGADVQGGVPRGILGPHVGPVEEQVLQMLHVAVPAGLK